MKSQTVIVDTIRNWKSPSYLKYDALIEHEVDYAKLFLATTEPEYYGNPEFQMIIFWDELQPIDSKEPRNEMINQLMRSFVHQWKLVIKCIRHDGLTTYVDCKATPETKECDNFDWIDVVAPKAELV